MGNIVTKNGKELTLMKGMSIIVKFDNNDHNWVLLKSLK